MQTRILLKAKVKNQNLAVSSTALQTKAPTKLITFYSTKKINITCSETKNACNILEIYEDIYGIIMRSVAFPEMNASAAFLLMRHEGPIVKGYYDVLLNI